MGCNAWNHPLNCDCGWGGGTGGYGRARGSSRKAPRRIVDGSDWSSKHGASYETFTTPNAACPVCGANVFFYQSPNGGRVFFDELGPPWPKHPCTDRRNIPSKPKRSGTHFTTGSVLDNLILAPTSSPKSKQGFSFVPPHTWRPLVAEKGEIPEPTGHYIRFPVDQRERIPGRHLYLPHDWPLDGPTFWRWHPESLGTIELTTLLFDESLTPKELSTSVPGWIQTDGELKVWENAPDLSPTPKQMNAVGWAFSFAWRLSKENANWIHIFPTVDMKMAKECFEIAAKHGFWAAFNNLGAIWRDGLGVTKDPEKAFFYFSRAAESGEVVPMRHLARCYREGFGCQADHNMAVHLDIMASDIEAMAHREAQSNKT